MYPHIKFGNSASNSIGDKCPGHNFLELRPEIKVTVTQKQYATKKMYPHTKFGILTSINKGYALETIFLEMGTEVKVTVTQKQYVTLCAYKVYPHTKLEIPTLTNTGDMLQIHVF